MKEYHKIQTIWGRDAQGTIMDGQFSLPEFAFLSNNDWVFTEKIDGTNIRVMYDGKNIVLGGKTDNAQIPQFLVNRLNELFIPLPRLQLLADIFPEIGTGLCLYGEGFGAKIQKGGENYKPDGQDFCLFDIWVNGVWLERESVMDIAQRLQLTVAPVIGRGTLQDAIEMTRKGFNSQWGGFLAEGIVARPAVELLNRRGNRIIAKIKHKDFLAER